MAKLIGNKKQHVDESSYIASPEIAQIGDLKLPVVSTQEFSKDELKRGAEASIKALEYLATEEAVILDEEFLRIIALADFNKKETVIALAKAIDAQPEFFDNFMQKFVSGSHELQKNYTNKVTETPKKIKATAADANNLAYTNVAEMLKSPEMACVLFENSTALLHKTNEKTADRLVQKNPEIATAYVNQAPQKATANMAEVFLAKQNIGTLLNTYSASNEVIAKSVAEKLVNDERYKTLVNNFEKVGFWVRLFSFIPAVAKHRKAKEARKAALMYNLEAALRPQDVQKNEEIGLNPVDPVAEVSAPAPEITVELANTTEEVDFSPVKPRLQSSVDDNGFSPLRTPIIGNDGFSPVKLKSQVKTDDGFSPVKLKSQSNADVDFSPVKLKSQFDASDNFSPVSLKSQSSSVKDNFSPVSLKSQFSDNDDFSPVKAQSVDDNGFSPLKPVDDFSPVSVQSKSDRFSPLSLPINYNHPANITTPAKNVPPPVARNLMSAFDDVAKQEPQSPSLKAN